MRSNIYLGSFRTMEAGLASVQTVLDSLPYDCGLLGREHGDWEIEQEDDIDQSVIDRTGWPVGGLVAVFPYVGVDFAVSTTVGFHIVRE